uniref:CheW-like domain-containing protein n=1 Tax=candidate division WOR-3 bacterium TaxID=2052148 RepID=A0A7C4YFD4_UNCW3
MKKKKISFQKAVEDVKKEEIKKEEEIKMEEKKEIPKIEKKEEKKVEEVSPEKIEIKEKPFKKPEAKMEAVMGIRVLREYYAIPIEDVVEITDVKIVPAPEMPDFLEGITEIRGKIIPVLDLARILEIGEQPEGKVILVDVKGELVGLKVTEILGMIKMKGKKIYSLPQPLYRNFLVGAIEYEGKILGIVELSNLLKDEFLQELKRKEK